MIVNVNTLLDILNYISSINKCDISQIDWIDGKGNPITFPVKAIEEWRFVGLNNVDFAKYNIFNYDDGYYLKEKI